ncbi:MAG: threonyl-tRNA synthetase [Candidatus Azotimanducaceae bacterium]|jgi:threonyl-tRNA synthetase
MSSEISNLEKKRHTLAHLLAASVLQNYPHAKLTLGPAIENGFYYDIDFSGGTPVSTDAASATTNGSSAPGDDDLKSIQKNMRKMLSSWKEFLHREVSADEAREIFKDNPFKTELINEIEEKGEAITLYTIGEGKNEFTDLCRGGHTENPAEEIAADAFKLDKVAGAYWRGSEENPMLTRIYGLAFDTKEELVAYEQQIEEAKKRDHRKIGKELGLFSFSDLVGPGLPLWSPKGTTLRREIDRFVTELRLEKGYELVTIPHLAKKELYETSGHWNKYSDDLFKVSAKVDTDGQEYVLKPMNCPHHTQIFDAAPRSYRDMPQRYAETTMVYRAEQSGELAGLTRVLSITQDDAHVFCRESQLKEEIEAIWDIVDSFYGKFDFKLEVSLSFRDMDDLDQYLGEPSVWDSSESIIKEIAESRNADYFIDPGEAAFYGPKLDFIARDSIGRKHQVATIQLDRSQPERFDLTFTNENGEKERAVMIHAAIAGSLERFSAVLIEHLAGNFPLRFAPVQVAVIPVSDAHNDYAQTVHDALKAAGLRVSLNTENESMGKKIRSAKKDKLPYFIVIGDKEVANNTVTLESRDTDRTETLALNATIKKLTLENH